MGLSSHTIGGSTSKPSHSIIICRQSASSKPPAQNMALWMSKEVLETVAGEGCAPRLRGILAIEMPSTGKSYKLGFLFSFTLFGTGSRDSIGTSTMGTFHFVEDQV